jgi:hypothetical protein
MPASVCWENEQKTIIRQQLYGDWTFEDYMTSLAELQRLTASMPHIVNVIVDYTETKTYPSKILAAAQTLDRNFPANEGIVMIVQGPPYINAAFEVIFKLSPKLAQKVHHVDSLEEAYHAIHRYEAQTAV